MKSSEFLNEETIALAAPMAQPAATAGQQFVGTGSSRDWTMSDTIATLNATKQMIKQKYGNRPPPGNGIELKYYNKQQKTIADPAKPGNYLTTVTFTPIESKLSPAISVKPSMDPNQDFDYFYNGQQVKPGDAFFDRIKQIHDSLGAGAVPSQPEAATNETAELDRILRLSGMELIAEGSTKSITVQRGDTLGRIAQDNSTTVAAIVKLNNIANPDRIFPGDVIRIPGGQGDPGGQAKRQGQPPAPDIDPDTDTDSDNISRVERAWLNMIAREESSDDYTAINFRARAAMKKGTMQITGKPGQHPFDGQSGVTAAGRYQMLYNTWKTAAKLAGVDPNDFSPENQDRAAIALAKNEYKRKYNRDLITDLQDPKRVDQAVRGSTGPWSVKAGGPGFSTQDYVSALSTIQAA
jgi:LysM repeat protein